MLSTISPKTTQTVINAAHDENWIRPTIKSDMERSLVFLWRRLAFGSHSSMRESQLLVCGELTNSQPQIHNVSMLNIIASMRHRQHG